MLKFSGYSCLIGGPNESLHWTVPWFPHYYRALGVEMREFEIFWQFLTSHFVSGCETRNVSVHVFQWTWNRKWKQAQLKITSRRTFFLENGVGSTKVFMFWVGINRHSNRHTPRRKCKLRSKFWWLTFCVSHDVSHFAAFFIVVWPKRSVDKCVYIVLIFIHWVGRRFLF